MPLEKSALFDFLDILNDELTRTITLIAVGGTAMTLLDLKPSTIDVDFTIPSNDFQEYKRAEKSMPPHGLKIHIWPDGWIFCQSLPDDYLTKSITIKRFTNILLKALHPADIVVTKIGRLDERDIQDIEKCIRKFNISKAEIETRAAIVGPTYVPRKEDYLHNLQWVIEKFF
jgi:hypothetical protein